MLDDNAPHAVPDTAEQLAARRETLEAVGIGYCHVGEQATAMLFAARTLGHRVVLYNGSFTDWIRRDRPVELPKQEK